MSNLNQIINEQRSEIERLKNTYNQLFDEMQKEQDRNASLTNLLDNCYLIRKSPTVRDLLVFMSAPVVAFGEKSSRTLYQEWAVNIDEEIRKGAA